MPDAEAFMKVREYAALIRVSASAIYRDPTRYHMFRVGGGWRANADSMKKFEQQSARDNNALRLAVVGGKEKKVCRSTKGVKRTGSISQHQTEQELDGLLAPRKRQKPSSCTTS